MPPVTKPTATPTQNACRLCAPLGASLAFRGIEGAIAVLHGSQGCATYIRRYLISHFREPVDIASSSFTEHSAIFGGQQNLHRALSNVVRAYSPRMIGVASTCLSETIGDDLPMLVDQYRKKLQQDDSAGPLDIVPVSTPAYSGSHADAFFAATRAVVETLCQPLDVAELGSDRPDVNLFVGLLSPEDLRYLRELCDDLGLRATILPDYSETLDGQAEAQYKPLPDGGTPLSAIKTMSNARASICLSETIKKELRPSEHLASRFGVEETVLGLPIGIDATDSLIHTLQKLAGRELSSKHKKERGRLVDAYVDAHKYLFGLKAAVYGDEDLVIGVTRFLSEIGVTPVICASGGKSGKLESTLRSSFKIDERCKVLDGVDYADIAQACRELGPGILIGGSKGLPIARELHIPLLRVGFPIHDRFGAQRVLHVGYRGTQQLFDRVVNTVLATRQDSSSYGYSYL
jgi:nitrogenase molybdenum-iron protein NifN